MSKAAQRPTRIDTALLDTVSAEARQAPRRRRNRNFHPDDAAPAHRLLNAIEPESYVAPHRHADPHKDETILCLRGSLGVVWFDAAGKVSGHAILSPIGPELGIDIPHGCYHTVLALEPGTVFFEAKAGPYTPLQPQERAAWAPAEGDAAASAYAEQLRALFAG